jgi:hypothetical protein
VGVSKGGQGTGNRRSAATVRDGRLRTALRQVLDLCLLVETGELAAERAVYESLSVAAAALERYRPVGPVGR